MKEKEDGEKVLTPDENCSFLAAKAQVVHSFKISEEKFGSF